MELNSRRVLYESHGDIRLPMASTTKIVTAATILDSETDITKQFTIPDETVGIEGSSVYLKSGEIYTVEDLLYGLMLRSGNDCAVSLALQNSGNIQTFAAKMNQTAQKAGAFDSHFENPHGLPSKNHYTTARDLSKITCYAMQNATFRKIVATKYYEPHHWQNKNKMLYLCDGGIGVKTGYTKEAGRCLVSAAERENMTLVCTVLNCPTTYERSIQLLNDAFSTYKNVSLLRADQPLVIKDGQKTLTGYARKDFSYPLLKEEEDLIEIKTFSVEKISKKDEIIGQFEIYLSKRLLFSGNLYKL